MDKNDPIIKKEILNARIITGGITAIIILVVGLSMSIMVKDNLTQLFNTKLDLERLNSKIEVLDLKQRSLEEKFKNLETEYNKSLERELNRAEQTNPRNRN